MKSDHQLKQDVTNELIYEPAVNESHIGVSAANGIVTLSGHIASYGEKYAAEKAAKRVAGVRGVANELEVKLGSAGPSDADLAASCVAALKASAAVPDEKLKVIVRDHWVTLEGQVIWNFQRIAAEQAIRYLVGIRGITNAIGVKPALSASDVKAKIEAAFRRSAEIDAARIQVEAHDGKVTLRGKVHSWMERNEALNAAWAAPGVNTVENDLIVAP